MARQLRIAYPGAYYHILARGNGKALIFYDDADRIKFLVCLEEITRRFGVVVHAYCLMGNHYHLLIETPQPNIAHALQYLNTAYVVCFNTKNRKTGHLLQGRYKSILVEKDAYLSELSRYIHLNPVRAGLVEHPDQWRWSSYRQYIGKETTQKFLTTEMTFRTFSEDLTHARELYREFVESVPRNYKKALQEKIRGGLILGTEPFFDWVRDTFLAHRLPDRELPQIKRLQKKVNMATIEKIVNKKVLDIGERRKIGIYLARMATSATLWEIALYFGGLTDSGVGHLVKRMEKIRKTDKKMDSLLRELESLSSFEV